jgi:hypothetical protein
MSFPGPSARGPSVPEIPLASGSIWGRSKSLPHLPTNFGTSSVSNVGCTERRRKIESMLTCSHVWLKIALQLQRRPRSPMSTQKSQPPWNLYFLTVGFARTPECPNVTVLERVCVFYRTRIKMFHNLDAYLPQINPMLFSMSLFSTGNKLFNYWKAKKFYK